MVFSSLSIIILFNASTLRRDLSMTFSRATLTSFILIIYINYASSYFKPLEKGLPLYNGLFQCNTNSHTFNLFIITLSFIILNLTSYYPRKANIDKNMFLVEEYNFRASLLKVNNSDLEDNIHLKDNTNQENNLSPKDDNNQIDGGEPFNLKGWPSNENQNKDDKELNANSDSKFEYVIDKTGYQFKILEYPLLILFVLSGAIFLISTNDIISIFISIELQSYGLYLLSSVYRNSELSTKAGLTYFLLGGLSSCIILLSQGLLYVNSGSTNLENIYILSNISTLGVVDILNNIYGVSYINVCLIILSVGFLFKVSAAPFHFWSPDVYDGVPTLVTTFIAIIAKISIFVFLLELVHYTSNNQTELSTYNWNNNLLISALLSLIIGSVLGLTQFRIKRLYAYSTISHVGFILLALSINTTESIQAFIFYLIQYSISNLNAFIILLAIGYFYINFYKNNEETNIHNELKERNNSPVQLITQIRGLYKLNTMLSLSFAITLFSFLGVPPLLGFFGKQMVLSASLDNGYVFMSLVAILTSVISAVYYLILIKQMFFEDSQYKNVDAVTKTIHVKLSSNITTVISTLTLITLLFMFTPLESLNLTQILSLYVMSI